MTRDNLWKVHNPEMISAILERVPLSFWESMHDLPEEKLFKSLPFAEEAYVRYDGFLNEQVCKSNKMHIRTHS